MHRSRVGALILALVFLSAVSATPTRAATFLRGDANGDTRVDLADMVSILFHLFTGDYTVPCEKAADVDDDGAVSITDAIFGLDYLFTGGAPPPPPVRGCGEDPTPDALSCSIPWCDAGIPSIRLEEECTPSPFVEYYWRLSNDEASAVSLDWELAGSDEAGSVELPASGEFVLTTAAHPGVNTLVVTRGGDEVARLSQARLLLSEILPSNATSLSDEDGDASDWIEIHAVDGPCATPIALEGWHLSDDPGEPARWTFPAVTLQPGDYLLVFASGKDRAVAGEDLHTNFQLSAGGEYLAITAPDPRIVADEFRPAFPEQIPDVSWGLARQTWTLIAPGHAAIYKVPTSADSTLGSSWTEPGFVPVAWRTGTVGLGFSGIETEGFDVTLVKSSVAVDHLTTALDVLGDPAKQSFTRSEVAPSIDYFNSGERGNFTVDRAFPGLGFADTEDFIVFAQGTVLVPRAGAWSFGVNSDDGFRLRMAGGGQNFLMEYPAPRGPSDTIQVFDIPVAGAYELSLVFYERGGGAELELFAAEGSHAGFDPAHFRLVGDAEGGGLALVGFAGAIDTDTGALQRGVNASLWARLEFTIDDPSQVGALWLRMRYEDGFVAYLNGSEVAARNAPAVRAWNSQAASNRSIENASVAEEISLGAHLDLLVAGRNVLAIHGMNDTAAEVDFLILPELIAAGREETSQYMSTPTPGRFNLAGAVDFVRSVEFSAERGFPEASFSLALTTQTAGAQIRYTLDGTEPTEGTGTLYSGPFSISRTSVVRAAAFKAAHIPAKAHTKTYIFVADVTLQSPTGQRPGPLWPMGSVNAPVIDYGMDPDIVNAAPWNGQIHEALLAIPSISLVTDLANIFSAATGIYVNAWNDGRAWERPTSVELLAPDGSPGFGVDAGLRIRGAFSRDLSNPKHSLRLFFRSEYGTSKLQYPLFGGEGVDEFDKIDLKTSQNYSWAYQGSAQNTFIRDVFSRDAQREMGRPYTRSRFYHLYLNGQYWGLYETEERADASFAESYLGGQSENYDVIKNDSSSSRALHATDGNMDAYRKLYDAAVAGFASDTAYRRIQGLKPDGTPDPAGERILDPDNLIDYMICTYYTGDPDAPVSCWGHISNNIFAIYDRVRREGFRWIRHDAEHSLGASGGLSEDRLLRDPFDRTLGENWQDFNPAWLHLRLTENAEYTRRFADRVSRLFAPLGVFSPERNEARWVARAGEIDLAVIAESARWGDAKSGSPLTRNHWLAEVNAMTSSYFPFRTDIVLEQFRSVAMFPEAAVVRFSLAEGEVAPPSELRLSLGSGTPGVIYYTLDSTDPRLPSGGVAASAEVYVDDSIPVGFVGRGAVWRYLDDGSNQGTSWRLPAYDDQGWPEGPAELGYGDEDEDTPIGYGPNSSAKYATSYFRRSFDVEDPEAVTALDCELLRDDGAVVYLNGVEVVRDNMPAGTIDYLTWASAVVGAPDESTFRPYSLDPGLLVAGRNVVAVEVHQQNGTSGDVSFDFSLTGTRASEGSLPIILDTTVTVKARVLAGTEWGALAEARYTVGLQGLVLNEVMASNHATLEDPAEPGEHPDWIEILNGTAGTIDLGGMFLTDDPQDLTKWSFAAGTTLETGQRLLVLSDDDGTQGPLHTNFKLSQSGETIVLVDEDGHTILDSIEFGPQADDVSWGRYPDGTGPWGYPASATPGTPNSQHSP